MFLRQVVSLCLIFWSLVILYMVRVVTLYLFQFHNTSRIIILVLYFPWLIYNLFSVTRTKLIFQYNYYVFHYAAPISPIVSYFYFTSLDWYHLVWATLKTDTSSAILDLQFFSYHFTAKPPCYFGINRKLMKRPF